MERRILLSAPVIGVLLMAAFAGSAHASVPASVSVATDKSLYKPGDTIEITGAIANFEGMTIQPILIRVTDPEGRTDRVDQVEVASDGSFSYSFVGTSLMTTPGTYTVTVAYRETIGNTTFEFDPAEKEDAAEPFTVKVGDRSYGVHYSIIGGTVFDIAADIEAVSLVISIIATDDGRLTIELPRELIDADEEFIVFVDEMPSETAAEIEMTDASRTLAIDFESGSEEIEIIGDSAMLPPLQAPSYAPFSNVFSNLRGAAINAGADKIYLSNIEYPADFIYIINATTLEQIGNVSANMPSPSEIVVDEPSDTVYLTSECWCPEAAKITVINGTSDKVTGSIDAGNYPVTKLAIDQAAGKIHAITNASFLATIDLATGNVSKLRLDHKTSQDFASSGLGTYDVAAAPAFNTTYVMDADKNSIIAVSNGSMLYNATFDSIPDEHAIGNRLIEMAVNPNTNVLYVINEQVYPPPAPNEGARIPIAYLAAVNGTSGEILSENITQINSFSYDLAVDPKRNIVYGLAGYNNIVAINGSNNKVIGEYPFTASEGFNARKLLVDPEANTLYIVAKDGIIKIKSPIAVSGKELLQRPVIPPLP